MYGRHDRTIVCNDGELLWHMQFCVVIERLIDGNMSCHAQHLHDLCGKLLLLWVQVNHTICRGLVVLFVRWQFQDHGWNTRTCPFI